MPFQILSSVEFVKQVAKKIFEQRVTVVKSVQLKCQYKDAWAAADTFNRNLHTKK